VEGSSVRWKGNALIVRGLKEEGRGVRISFTGGKRLTTSSVSEEGIFPQKGESRERGKSLTGPASAADALKRKKKASAVSSPDGKHLQTP